MLTQYVDALGEILDMEAISKSGIRMGVDPLGGSGLYYWDRIADKYNLNLKVVNYSVDPTFSFMCIDRDGKIRMDCSSPYAMAGLIKLKDDFDIAWGNDPDYDRHGIVCHSGLMNPNHYLSAAINYIYTHRDQWPKDAMVGKTVVSSNLMNRVAAGLGRKAYEVPVGFKWFVPGLLTSLLLLAAKSQLVLHSCVRMVLYGLPIRTVSLLLYFQQKCLLLPVKILQSTLMS